VNENAEISLLVRCWLKAANVKFSPKVFPDHATLSAFFFTHVSSSSWCKSEKD